MALVVIGCGVLAACSNATSPPAAPATGPSGSVNVRMDSDWNTLDPDKFSNTGGNQVILSAYDRLVAFDAKGNLLPYLASSWRATPTSITFTLRSGPTCADGTPVTPTVVLNSFKRMTASPGGAPNLGSLFGPGPFQLDASDSDHTFTITSATPFNELLAGFATPWASVICPAGITALNANPATVQTFGSGAYTLESAAHGDGVRMKARPEWKWGPGGISATAAGFPAEINYKIVASETTAANLLSTGALDLGKVSGPDIARLNADTGLKHHDFNSYRVDPLVFNEGAGQVTADDAVRQAIMTAVDPKAWNQAAFQGHGIPATSLFASNEECYDSNSAKLMPKPGVDAARTVLSSAGYAAGANGKFTTKDGKPLALIIIGYSGQNAGPEYLLETLNAVGFTATLNKTDLGGFSVNVRGNNWQVAVVLFAYSYPNAGANIRTLSGKLPSEGGSNLPRIVDPTLESAISEATSATTEAAKCQGWAKVQERYLQAHHLLPTVAEVGTWYAKKQVDYQGNINNVDPWSIRVH